MKYYSLLFLMLFIPYSVTAMERQLSLAQEGTFGQRNNALRLKLTDIVLLEMIQLQGSGRLVEIAQESRKYCKTEEGCRRRVGQKLPISKYPQSKKTQTVNNKVRRNLKMQ